MSAKALATIPPGKLFTYAKKKISITYVTIFSKVDSAVVVSVYATMVSLILRTQCGHSR